MFRGLINDAKVAAGSLIGKYVARASVAVPFIVALGFGTAALAVFLVDRFGHLYAYIILAGGFAFIGLVAMLAVNAKEQEEEAADALAAKTDTKDVARDAAAQAAAQAPLAMLGALLASPAGPSTLAGSAKLVARNMPLVVLLALIGLLFWPVKPQQAGEATDTNGLDDRPDGRSGPVPNGLHRQAA
jgi:hypothetical protein